MEPTDPRLAALYDEDNPDGPDHEYFRTFADRADPDVVVDLGCGTGLLTTTLVADGRTVIGIDPDPGMLDIAMARPGAENVRWQLGDSRTIDQTADLVLMTGNVAQHIGPHEWHRTLTDIAAALSPTGWLAFESRNPTAQEWRGWTRDNSEGTRMTPAGLLTEWVDATEPDAHGTVVLTAMNRWEETGEELTVTQRLTFRTADAIAADLTDAGLGVHEVFGGWNSEPLDETSRLIVIEARPAETIRLSTGR